MAQHTINIQCSGDTYTDKSNPNTNYGSQTALNAGGTNYRYDSYLLFDLSSIPLRKKIISATLFAYLQSLGLAENPSYPRRMYVHPSYGSDLTEANITYNNRPTSYTPEGRSIDLIGNTGSYITMDAKAPITHAYGEPNVWLKIEDSLDLSIPTVFASKETANKPYLEIVYEDVPPSAPTPTDPIGTYKDNKSIIRFEWQYNSDVGGTQKAFDLQWSTDQINWTTVSQTISNMYYDMPADTLPAGNIYWRVRCYNEYDEVGPYCDIQSFYAIGAPAAPVLNAIPSNTARPVVTWSAFNQQVYQLQVLSGDSIVYDSGIVPGISIRQHKIKLWLEDGEYTVKLRIKNEYDLWSEWSSATVTISTVKPAKPTVTASKTATGIKLTVPVGRMLIYRDSICIGETSTGEYFDNAVANGKEYEYVARSIHEVPIRQVTNLVDDGSFENATTKWQGRVIDTAYKKIGNNSSKVVSPDGVNPAITAQNISFEQGKKYYIAGWFFKAAELNEVAELDLLPGEYGNIILYDETLNTWQLKSDIITVGSTVPDHVRVFSFSTIPIFVDCIIIVNLTDTYGSGNEPTKDDCDILFADWFDGNKEVGFETFNDSDPVLATAEFKNAHIAPASDLTDVFTFTRSLNGPPKRTYNCQPGGAFVEYSGRKSPVWEPTEHSITGWTMTYYLKTWADVEKFTAIYDLNDTVLYRDSKGRKMYGILSNLSVNDERTGYTVSFTINQVDYNEGLEV